MPNDKAYSTENNFTLSPYLYKIKIREGMAVS